MLRRLHHRLPHLPPGFNQAAVRRGKTPEGKRKWLFELKREWFENSRNNGGSQSGREEKKDDEEERLPLRQQQRENYYFFFKKRRTLLPLVVKRFF